MGWSELANLSLIRKKQKPSGLTKKEKQAGMDV
jgi:hypothetical protein